MLKEHDLTEARSEISGLPTIDLRQAKPEPEALALIPDSVAREHFVIPMNVDETGLTVAVADEPSPELMNLLRETAGTTVRPVLAPISDIRSAIDSNYRAIGGLDHLVQAFEAVEETRKRPAGTPSGATELLADDAPVVQVVGTDPDSGHARPGLRRPHRAQRDRASGSATASTVRSRRS